LQHYRFNLRKHDMQNDDQDQRPPAPQHQSKQPGHEQPMVPQPIVIRDDYRGSAKLEDKVALITGGDSGIGRSVAVHYAREGADIAIIYLDEHDDAQAMARSRLSRVRSPNRWWGAASALTASRPARSGRR
jgi:hypothetical protein